MPKKRQLAEGGEAMSTQVYVRLTPTLHERIDDTASGLGLDTSSLIRLILSESLPSYEDRARHARAKGGKLG